MISIFNGRTRELGKTERKDVFIQVSVSLREHLHLFKGCKLSVFMAIALHSDQNGWSHPSLRLLRKETGYNKGTISQAITELCQLEIAGERLLLAVQDRLGNGLLDVNRYLIFPSKEELNKYEEEDPQLLRKARARQPRPENPVMDEPRPEKPYTVEPYTVGPDMVNSDRSITREKKNQLGEEQTERRTTHNMDAGVGTSPADNTRSKSNYSLDECRRYADHLYETRQGIRNPGGYARSIHNSGVADPQIKQFFSDIEREASIGQNNKSCHRCQGTGFYYPEDTRAGVIKCLHI